MHVLKDVKAHGLSFTLTCLICMVFQSFTFAHTLKLVTPYRCKTVCCRKKGDKGLGWFCTERPLGRRNDENDKLSNAAKDGDFNDGESLMTR